MTTAWGCSLPYAVDMTLRAVEANDGQINNYYGSIDGEVTE